MEENINYLLNTNEWITTRHLTLILNVIKAVSFERPDIDIFIKVVLNIDKNENRFLVIVENN